GGGCPADRWLRMACCSNRFNLDSSEKIRCSIALTRRSSANKSCGGSVRGCAGEDPCKASISIAPAQATTVRNHCLLPVLISFSSGHKLPHRGQDDDPTDIHRRNCA